MTLSDIPKKMKDEFAEMMGRQISASIAKDLVIEEVRSLLWRTSDSVHVKLRKAVAFLDSLQY